MWFRRPTIYEQRPETLHIVALFDLHSALLLKLISVNEELLRRNDNMTTLVKGMPDEKEMVATLSAKTGQLRSLNAILKQVLSQSIGDT